MLFNSIHFFLFLPIVVGLYYLLPKRMRWLLILLASCYFYTAFFWPYLLLLFLLIGIDYYSGIVIEQAVGEKKRKRFLVLSILANIGLLAVFKYTNFFIANANDLAAITGSSFSMRQLNILLPIGLSFHTFQSLSYVIDVYRGNQKAEKDLRIYANYVLFFPQMVAGPIERFSQLGKELHKDVDYSSTNIVEGLRLIMFGLFVKMCVADPLAGYVNTVYADPSAFSAVSVGVALCCFSIQIYADFHGYSTIAIGSARMLGIELMDNFNRPYFASDIHAFWQRWHISLTRWFRLYVYIPLGGNRVNKSRWMINILLVFGVSGLWHGANWTFVFWGVLHGYLYILWYYLKGKSTDELEQPVWKTLSAVITFILVTLIWVFFRSEDFEKVTAVFTALFSGKANTLGVFPNTVTLLPLLLFLLLEIIRRGERFDVWFARHTEWQRWSWYGIFLAAILLLSGMNSQPFIYFQF